MSTVVDPTEYVIRTRFETASDIPGLGLINRRIDGLTSKIEGIGSSLSRAFSIAGVSAGVAGVVGLTRKVVGLHTEIQNAETGIASLYSAMGKVSMTTALSAARTQLRGLQQDAAKGAGSLQDYTQGYQLILGPARSAGASLEQIRNLNRLTLTAGFALRGQEGLKLAPMDVVQALQGGAGSRTTPIVNQALQAIGVSQAKFNAMSAPKRLETLEKAFGTFEAAAEAMGHTWEAQSATFSDTIQSITREISKPLFDRWTEQLETANDWLSKNRDILSDMADGVGQRLLRVYDTIGKHAGGLGAGGVGLAAGAVGMRGAGLAVGALGVEGAAAGGIAALVGGVFASIGYAITLAMEKFDFVRRYVSSEVDDFVGSMTELGGAFMDLMESPWISWIGASFGLMVGGFLQGAAVFARGFAWFIENLNRGFSIWYEYFSMTTSGLSVAMGLSDDAGAPERHRREGDRLKKELWDSLSQDAFEHVLFGDGGRVARKGTKIGGEDMPFGGNVTNINGPVSIEIKPERVDDPHMVATTFEAVMNRLARHPRAAAASRLAPKPVR